ncbi:non-ribosomal peptide synthetase [Amycolatopsis pigmentata]|uniref:Amino acid adenylation domain-containing protein n=1 Tax=Amycolatopsis pigmentata TaxID=450801 RepID=A0ABW5FM39_9PSEU
MTDVSLPLSSGQRRLWTLFDDDAAIAAYNDAITYTLRGPLDHDVLRAALDELVARHEALRTRLVVRDGTLGQRAEARGLGCPLTVTDLSGRHHLLDELVHTDLHETFDPKRAPLLRARLVILGPDHHVLLMVVHHSVYDGWSLRILLRELGMVYTALVRGERADLPEPSWQFSDYARWEAEWLAGAEPAPHEAYWSERLAGVPALLELPTDRPRPAEQDYRGGHVPVLFGEELTAALKTVARDHGVTLYSTILTCWFILLSRLSGQDDIVVGVPAANRGRPETENLFGFLANTLPLRAGLAGSPSGAALLKRVRASLREAADHVELPFERMIELVNPPRSPAHTPLFQTMVSWVPDRNGLLELAGVQAVPREIPDIPAKFDLVLTLADKEGGVAGDLDFALALYDRATAERFVRYLLRLAWQIAERPDDEVASYELMDEAERRALLADWSTGPEAEPRPGGLVERFEAWADRCPDRTAVVAGEARLSYAELDRRACRLAGALRARGVRPGQLVGLRTGRTAELVVGLLGILKAGAVYLPLDPAQPATRLAAMVEDAAPALVLDDDNLPVSAVESEVDSDGRAGIRAAPEDAAYVIYTSGSTGRPKGVVVTHRSLLALFDQWVARFGAIPGEAASAWSGIGFDASLHELLLPLTSGGVLHVVPEDMRGDPSALMAWLREHQVAQAFLPPAYIRWIDEDPAGRLAGLSLRLVLTGVESLPEAALARMTGVLPGLRVLFGYGPTEATLYAVAYTGQRLLERSCPIGKPLPGSRLYLLDQQLRPVPPGVVGEVHLAGACLARGYLHRPDLTAERFVPDPFRPGERMYRTGDLARWLPNGDAVYVGRRDDQVKVRGFRVEPGEVEATLLAVPGVREAAVLVDRDGEPRLLAGVASDKGWTPHEWREALADRLPDYMIPSTIAEFDRLPLSRNGKLDREALLENIRDAVPAQVNTASPRDHVELALYRIWRNLLRHPAIGISDTFFDVGGTSVSAIKLVHAISAEFGRLLPVREVILHPTIEELAALLRSDAPVEADGGLIEFRRGDGRQRVVCVHPAGGTAFCYLPLSTALPERVGVVGLQARGINPGETALPSVEAMAEEYLRLVAPKPDESLVLCGLSCGGLVAYEMGRALADHPRVSVVLLDTNGTDDTDDTAGPVPAEEFREKLVRFNGMYPGIDDSQIDRYHRTYNHNRATAGEYRPGASGARVVFVRAADDATEGAVEFWRKRARGEFRVEPVGSGHWDLLESGGLRRVVEVITAELAALEVR